MDKIIRLKYRLEPIENDMVEFQIYYQDHKIKRSDNNKVDLIGEFGGWKIWSVNKIHISVISKKMFLLGESQNCDSIIFTFKGHDLIPSIHKALEEMVKKVFGNCTVVKG